MSAITIENILDMVCEFDKIVQDKELMDKYKQSLATMIRTKLNENDSEINDLEKVRIEDPADLYLNKFEGGLPITSEHIVSGTQAYGSDTLLLSSLKQKVASYLELKALTEDSDTNKVREWYIGYEGDSYKVKNVGKEAKALGTVYFKYEGTAFWALEKIKDDLNLIRSIEKRLETYTYRGIDL